MMRIAYLTVLSLLSACTADTPQPAADEPAERPNILLIIVDDMGFSDLGSFGGEIPTPNLDRLAYDGVRFSNFHVASTCSPSRAMLFTGVDSHLAGLGNMQEELSPNQLGQRGYEGYLNEDVVTFTELLGDAGYRNYMTGKWHLGNGDVSSPESRGFDRSFVLDAGGASHYPDMKPSYAPSPEIKASYREDGARLTGLPPEFTYSSQYYVDKMIDYLDDHDADAQPFFAYLSFTAPHWPLQAPEAAIARHEGRYDDGYDVLAEARLSMSKALGLIPQHAGRAARSAKEVPFADLDDEQRKFEIRAMEVYAAMIDEVDVHTGRLIDFMESNGLLDNTIILFMSDNGAEGHDLDETWPMEAFPEIRKTIDAVHDFSYDNIGRPNSYTLLGPNWANATAPALWLHKAYPTEGGTRVAAFAHFPETIPARAISDDFVYVTDIAPTLLELAGVEHPGTQYAGRTVEAVSGESFVSILEGTGRSSGERVVGMELFGKRSIQVGDWKIVHMPLPHGIDDWQMFNVRDDISESNDLSNQYPDRLAAMKVLWEKYADDNNVIIPDWVSGY